MSKNAYNEQGLKIVVAKRVMPSSKESSWTWTLHEIGPHPLARAEYSWGSPHSARNDAYKFCKKIGMKIPIHYAGDAKEYIEQSKKK